MRKYLFLGLTFGFLFQMHSVQAGGVEFLHDWDKALAKAKKENKYVFLDAYTDWCGPCKWMAANVMTQDQVGAFFNKNFVNVKLDMEKGVGKEVAAKYKVEVYPTLGFFDGAGNMVWRAFGALPAEKFLELGSSVLENAGRVSEMTQTFETGKYSRDFLYEYLMLQHQANLDHADALAQYVDEMKNEDLLTEQGWNVFQKFFEKIDTEQYKYFEKNRNKFAEKFGQDQVDEKYYSTQVAALGQAMMAKDAAKVKSISKVLEGNGGEMVQAEYLNMMLYWTKENEGKEAVYNLLTDWVQDGKDLHWSTLNQYAWEVYESEDDPEIIDMALAWIEVSVEKERSYFNLDTQAMLYYKGGNLDRAITIAEEAIQAAKEVGEDASPTEEALEKMREEFEGK